MSYDTWKQTNPADATLGRADGKPDTFRCLVCDWRGTGVLARSDHWQETQHRPIVDSHDPRYGPQRGMPCARCGKPMHRIYTLADVGAFCSPGCRQQATEPQQKAGAA